MDRTYAPREKWPDPDHDHFDIAEQDTLQEQEATNLYGSVPDVEPETEWMKWDRPTGNAEMLDLQAHRREIHALDQANTLEKNDQSREEAQTAEAQNSTGPEGKTDTAEAGESISLQGKTDEERNAFWEKASGNIQFAEVDQSGVSLHAFPQERSKPESNGSASGKNNDQAGLEKGALPLGTKLHVLSKTRDQWLQVRALTDEGIRIGYVDFRYVEPKNMTWEWTENVKEGAYVREKKDPLNYAFVEDFPTLKDRYEVAKGTQAKQEERAKGFMKGGVPNDGRYWFTKVYAFVTGRELEIVRNKNLYYPSLNLLAVQLFDRIYEDNLARYDLSESHLGTDQHWTEAFDKINSLDKFGWRDAILWNAETLPMLGNVVEDLKNRYEAVKSLVKGMQAHIRFDLPRALNYAFIQHVQSMETHPEFRFEEKNGLLRRPSPL